MTAPKPDIDKLVENLRKYPVMYSCDAIAALVAQQKRIAKLEADRDAISKKFGWQVFPPQSFK